MKSGIYKISFKGCKHFYIGCATSLTGRKASHRSSLRRHKHHNPIMQRCFDKYGDVLFEVLENCYKSKLLEREQFYIDLLKPSININLIANREGGYHWTEAQRANCKIYRKEVANRPEVQAKTKATQFKKGHIPSKEIREGRSIRWKTNNPAPKTSIIQMDEKGNNLHYFQSVKEAMIQFNTKKCTYLTVTECCKGQRGTYRGFKWKYPEFEIFAETLQRGSKKAA